MGRTSKVGGRRRSLFDALQITNLRWHLKPPGVYVFNYHRVGRAADSEFDRDLFSCTPERLTEHIKFLQAHFDLIDPDQLAGLIQQRSVDRCYAMITFDDGYLDNYTNALPVIKALNCPATFFITANFAAQVETPWWDAIAWMIRNAKVEKFQSFDGRAYTIPSSTSLDLFIESFLTDFKWSKEPALPEKLRIVAGALGYPNCDGIDRPEMMNWDQVRQASAQGISIGAHSMSHPMLSFLSDEQQYLEISQSKKATEQELGSSIRAFSYPVGNVGTFSDASLQLVAEAGFDLAFTYDPGVNNQPWNNTYTLARYDVMADCDAGFLKYSIANIR